MRSLAKQCGSRIYLLWFFFLQAAFYKEERDVMASSKSSWITQLQFAFQDDNFLFLVMEYVAGGSLLNLLFKLDIFDEDQTRFYVAEIAYAIEEIHQMGYCHRFD